MLSAPIRRLAPTRGGRRRRSPFRGPLTRRLTGEQLLNALASATGHWPSVATVDSAIPGSASALAHREPSSLAVSLGRPVRDVVNSERPDAATTLEALELVNGEALTGLLSAGAGALLASDLGREVDTGKVMDILCIRMFGRRAGSRRSSSDRKCWASPGKAWTNVVRARKTCSGSSPCTPTSSTSAERRPSFAGEVTTMSLFRYADTSEVRRRESCGSVAWGWA